MPRTGRRLAQRHERRTPQFNAAEGGAGPAARPTPLAISEDDDSDLALDPSAAQNAAPAPNFVPAPGAGNDTLVPLPPSDPAQTSDAVVSIPRNLSVVIPATCGVLGFLAILGFTLWCLYLRRQRRRAKAAAAAAPNYDAETMAKSVKLTRTPTSPTRGGLPSSPKDLKPQVDWAQKKGSGPELPIAVKLPTSPSANNSDEKYSFNLPMPPPPAVKKRFSIFNEVRKMPEFRDREAKPVRSFSTRSASLLSSRMSQRRRPNQAAAPPVPDVPSVCVTDCDTPAGTSVPVAKKMEGKLVGVVATFESTMPDELPVAIGETLRVVEVYEDDWCLAERVGRKKGRGIVPQACIAEKQLVEKKRFSMLMMMK
ncbi:hypothetical protein AURDEDRAFT_133932 [Auricularia subglabra TFB-10046 SS5]|nr:hypothetical protein AURDEDRAFT_133932 [Auricularia subglabra TFB-10046 SS5]